jgi:hypothetical protein
MPLKKNLKWDEWALSLEKELGGLGVSKKQFARVVGVDSASLYRWFRKPLTPRRKNLVHQALGKVRANPLGAVEEALETVDRSVNQQTNVSEDSRQGGEVKHGEAHMRAGGTLRAEATVVDRSPLGHILDQIHQLEQMAHEYHEQGEQKIAQACTEAAGVLKAVYREKQAS